MLTAHLIRYGGYAEIWNLLDYPAAIIPVTTVDRDIDVQKQSDESAAVSDNARNPQTEGEYDPDVYHGAPVSLQIICRPWCEEHLLNVSEVVDCALKGIDVEQLPPGTSCNLHS